MNEAAHTPNIRDGYRQRWDCIRGRLPGDGLAIIRYGHRAILLLVLGGSGGHAGEGGTRVRATAWREGTKYPDTALVPLRFPQIVQPSMYAAVTCKLYLFA
jgi:hypothetical protein